MEKRGGKTRKSRGPNGQELDESVIHPLKEESGIVWEEERGKRGLTPGREKKEKAHRHSH